MESITMLSGSANSPQCAIFAFDVSKDTLNVFSRIGKKTIERSFRNRTGVVETQLTAMAQLAKAAGAEKILVVAESTGNFHDILMRAARRVGLETAWVSGEAVAKMRVIETNDTGKTDIKDPHVIHSLASIGKTLIHRDLEEPYSLLRQWKSIYDAAEVKAVEAKCAIASQLYNLFPDFGFTTDFLYSDSGAALMQEFGGNPYRIVATGLSRFSEAMKKAAPRIRQASISQLFEQAHASAKNNLPLRHTELLELRLRQLWAELQLHDSRKQEAAEAMEQLYEEARKKDRRLPKGQKGVISNFHLARIVAETGPLSDFESWRKLMRFAGLNLRERQSGKYRGKTRIAKKGRSGLRKILGQVVLPLVRHNGLFGEYYHRRKEETKMPGTKLMTIVMRKFLKMLFGWYRSGGEFQVNRIFACESRYRMAA